MKKTISVLFTLFIGFSLLAQKSENGVKGPDGYIRCATTEYNAQLRNQHPNSTLSPEEFEDWIAPKIQEIKTKRQLGLIDNNVVLTIPVVIHIIHDGDPINTPGNNNSENISYEQAVSQVDVLNQDFRRLQGSPGAGTSGYNLGIDTEVEFCLATQDPNGAATNGVNRVNLCQSSWSTQEINNFVKPETIWDPTKYMNMWSVNFTDTSLLGYAQFPSASGLQGLNTNGGAASTDGVVSNYNAFGTIAEDDGSFIMNGTYNLGRTMTHEVGHWLGLRHIWGDGGCGQDDFCADTPASSTSNFQCNQSVHCGSADMTENYMDYTNDACMDTFTPDQKSRIVAVLNNSPRRMELVTTSNGCQAGTAYNLDAEIILTCPSEPLCDTGIIPVVELVNRGTATLNSAQINYTIANGEEQTFTWQGSLQTYEREELALPFATAISGTNLIEVEIGMVNGSSDELTDNNTDSQDYIYAAVAIEEYDFTDYTLTIVPDDYGSEITWELIDSAGNEIYTGGPYSNNNSDPITVDFELGDNNCYTFTIYDDFGDGICCQYGTGSYEIVTSAGDIVVSGGSYEELDSTPFRVGSLSTDKNEFANSIEAYPNPSNGILNVKLPEITSNEANFTMFDLLGRTVMKNTAKNGGLTTQLDIATLPSGVYLLQVEVGGKIATKKVIKE